MLKISSVLKLSLIRNGYKVKLKLMFIELFFQIINTGRLRANELTVCHWLESTMSLKSLILKGVRNGLGLIIVFFDWISRPKGTQRSESGQTAAQASMQGLSLYQFFACPFCVKTRRAIHKLNVKIEPRDINKSPKFRQQLEAGGGRVKVPCLRIEEAGDVRWMYESNNIISFLENRV